MGATLRQCEPEFDQPSNTEQLFNWISRVRTKKIKYLRNRRRNIRVEAVLGYALTQAEQELRTKQIARINRWQQLKKQMASGGGCGNGNAGYPFDESSSSGGSGSSSDDDDAGSGGGGGGGGHLYIDAHCGNPWGGNMYPELNSLDTFMSKLSEVKVPLQR